MGGSSSIQVVRQQTVSVFPHLSLKQNIEIVKLHIDDLEYQFKNKILKMKKMRELAPLLTSVSETSKTLKDGLTKNMIVFENNGTGTFIGVAKPAPRSYDEIVGYLHKINDEFDKLYLQLGLPLSVSYAVPHLTETNMIPPEAYAEYENIGK